MNETILQTRNITKKYGGKAAVDNISMTIKKGDIYGLIGRNGAGKTTMFNCLTGNLTPDSGEITMEFSPMEKRPATFDDMGLVLAQPHLPEFMTGQEFLKFFIDINKDKIDAAVDMDADFTLIGFAHGDRHKLIREYSYGMKNKLQILAFLILRPSVILLDEPLTSFDVVVALQIKNLIESIKKDHVIIFSTHILPLAQDLCDEIVILHNGKLTELDASKTGDKDFESQIIAMMTEDKAND
ncbi:MAG: ABC transporter ATP-binding protein [Defluviitaleaceae bacterium]|nr:ABC transporter ATP-binding protein [Defluviitaleaceae bacterium]